MVNERHGRTDRPERQQAFEPTGRFAIEVVGAIVLSLATLIAVGLIGLHNHFECGGGLGLFGGPPDLNRDESCMSRRRWLQLIPVAIALGIVVLIVRGERRRRR